MGTSLYSFHVNSISIAPIILSFVRGCFNNRGGLNQTLMKYFCVTKGEETSDSVPQCLVNCGFMLDLYIVQRNKHHLVISFALHVYLCLLFFRFPFILLILSLTCSHFCQMNEISAECQ